MKKFYISIFSAVFLFSSFASKAQYTSTYATIANDGNYHSLTTDPTTWVGGIVPSFPCTSCDIVINCLATLDFYDGNFTPIVVDQSRILVTAGNSLTVNNALWLKGTSILQIGSDGSSPDTLIDNAQISMQKEANITLANPATYIDVTNPNSVTVAYSGNFVLYGTAFDPSNIVPGIYTFGVYPGYPPDPSDPNFGTPGFVYQYAYTLTTDGGYGTPQLTQPYYNFNCGNGIGFCSFGYVNGPATTTQIDDGGGGNIHMEFISSTTLPVQLVQLLARKNADGTVGVLWSTSQEANSDYYDVERSSSGQSGWTKLGTVKAKGYSSTTTNYNFTDKLPLDGTGYYRLKMVDRDGVFTYSKTVTVTSSSTSVPLVIYSNPFNDQIRLKVNVSRAQDLSITVSDMLGKTYISESYHAQSGDNFVNLLPNATASGMYILRIQGDSYSQTVKLEKQ